MPDLDIAVPGPTSAGLQFVLGYPTAKLLRERLSANFEFEDDRMLVSWQDLTFEARTAADLYTLYEVFYRQDYAFHVERSTYVVDLGMNVGVASMFFAKECDAEVLAFELVPSTFEQAERNFALNPKYANRIQRHPYGLAATGGEFEIGISEVSSAESSLYTKREGGRTVHVKVRDAAEAIRGHIEANSDKYKVLKIDVEGAEYEILQRLQSDQLFSRFDLVFMEWHEIPGHGLPEIRELLIQAGFIWTERRDSEPLVGFIVAWQ